MWKINFILIINLLYCRIFHLSQKKHKQLIAKTCKQKMNFCLLFNDVSIYFDPQNTTLLAFKTAKRVQLSNHHC